VLRELTKHLRVVVFGAGERHLCMPRVAGVPS
jgi:hypothetical protein